MELRRHFALSASDEAFLNEYGLPWETVMEGSPWVVVHEFPTHEGYNHSTVSIAVRLESGYPQAQLDMVYVCPALARRDGKTIPKTQATQDLDGKSWQRWSRHRTAVNPWRPGVDSLETHIGLIEDWLVREFERCPAPVPA